MNLFLTTFCVIFTSMLLSLAESSIVGSNEFKVKNMIKQEISGSSDLLKVISQRGKYLTSIIFMNTIVNIGGSMLIGTLAAKYYYDFYYTAFIGSVTVVMLLLSEIKPKVFASSRPEKVGKLIAKPLILITKLISPIIYVINLLVGSKSESDKLTICELDYMLKSAHDLGVINNKEAHFIQNLFSIRERKACELIIKDCEIQTVPIHETIEFAKELSLKSNLKRFIATNKHNQPVGVVFKSDILGNLISGDKNMSIAEIVHPVLVCQDDKSMMELLEKLYRTDTHLAVVTDKEGKMIGVVTLSNIQESILSV